MFKPLRILLLAKYERLAASTRLRTMQYLPMLEAAGIQVAVQSLLSDDLLQARRQRGAYAATKLLPAYAERCRAMLKRHQFDLVWIEKEALPWWPLWLEQALLSGVPYVLDYDDAIFHNYDQHANAAVRTLLGRRLDGLMAGAALVVCGNQYLAKRARDAGASWVEVLPTVIDLHRYPQTQKTPATPTPATYELPRIVWIGSPSTVRYLQLLHKPLQELAKLQPFVFRVIGGGAVAIPGVLVEMMPWAENTEVENITTCDVGVMPLVDSPWEKGKCGYKLIQYMACGLPVVASGVGVNTEIVQQGVNGFLADTPDEWVAALGKLLLDRSLRRKMGQAGRLRVETQYCLQVTGPKLAGLLRQVAGESSPVLSL
jgi:glycosyltransferase involved in cell wall biosynthesis